MGGGVSFKPQPEEAAGTWFLKYGSNLKQPVTAPERPSNKAPPTFQKCEVAGCPYEAEINLKCCRGHEMQKPGTVFTIGAPDNVNNPPHYNQGAVECIDAIESALGAEGFRAYCKGNALKYIWREEHKGGDESLRKAVWYLNRLVKP